jgi:hypothetical protein
VYPHILWPCLHQYHLSYPNPNPSLTLAPVCPAGTCINGTCVSPSVCFCSLGYSGLNCGTKSMTFFLLFVAHMTSYIFLSSYDDNPISISISETSCVCDAKYGDVDCSKYIPPTTPVDPPLLNTTTVAAIAGGLAGFLYLLYISVASNF